MIESNWSTDHWFADNNDDYIEAMKNLDLESFYLEANQALETLDKKRDNQKVDDPDYDSFHMELESDLGIFSTHPDIRVRAECFANILKIMNRV